MEIAKPIDLAEDRAKLSDQLSRLLKMEGVVYDKHGVDCDIKWAHGGQRPPCLTCPHSQAEAPDGGGPLGTICRIGLKQIRVLDQLDRHSEIEALEDMAERMFLAEECEELAVLAAA